MEFFELVNKRFSVRSYKDRDVSADQLHQLVAAANKAPSAGNLQAYEMYVVTEEETREAIATAAYDQNFVADAPALVIFFQDPDRSARKYDELGRDLFSVQDATIAAAYLQLAATELSLGTCWLGVFDREEVSDLLGLDKYPLCIITVGYPATRSRDKSRRDLRDIVTFEDPEKNIED